MRMPDTIPTTMFAPCGMNCMVCYRHCVSKKSCGGCFQDTDGKSEGCKSCRIQSCVKEKGIQYCFSCKHFPCKLIQKMDKRYRDRYNQSLIENSIQVREHGLVAFLAAERSKWICGKCDRIISLHDNECSECRTFSEKKSYRDMIPQHPQITLPFLFHLRDAP